MHPLHLAAAHALLLASVASCDGREVYAFRGQRYDPTGDCLEANTVIDVVEGDPGPRCDGVRCFERSDGEVFVSAQCQAAPDFVDATTQLGGACQLALAAYALGDAAACPASG